MEQLLDGEAETLTRKAIELAKGGDLTALRICLDRICPARKDRHVSFALPAIETPADAVKASAAIAAAVADGELTPSEAGDLARVIEAWTRTVEATEITARLDKLEAATRK